MLSETDAAGELCRRALLLVARRIEPHFRQYTQALLDELSGTKLSSERWSRIARVVNSLRSVPGELLTDEERDCRGHALRALPLIEKIQQATFGLGRTDESLQFVRRLAPELIESLNR